MTPHDGCRVSPFGHPRIKACSAAPRGFSQLTTSFIGSRRLGIHRWLFVAWKNKDARARYAILKGLDERRATRRSETTRCRLEAGSACPRLRTTRPRAGEPVIGALGALPGNRRENERPRARASREIRGSTTAGPCFRTSNQCINWVVARWPGHVARAISETNSLERR